MNAQLADVLRRNAQRLGSQRQKRRLLLARDELETVNPDHTGASCLPSRPATWPDDQAHWRLKPPQVPSTFNTSPAALQRRRVKLPGTDAAEGDLRLVKIQSSVQRENPALHSGCRRVQLRRRELGQGLIRPDSGLLHQHAAQPVLHHPGQKVLRCQMRAACGALLQHVPQCPVGQLRQQIQLKPGRAQSGGSAGEGKDRRTAHAVVRKLNFPLQLLDNLRLLQQRESGLGTDPLEAAQGGRGALELHQAGARLHNLMAQRPGKPVAVVGAAQLSAGRPSAGENQPFRHKGLPGGLHLEQLRPVPAHLGDLTARIQMQVGAVQRKTQHIHDAVCLVGKGVEPAAGL